MIVVKLDKVQVMGEKHETFGYTYWCSVEGSGTPVRFSSLQAFSDGVSITYEESQQRTSSKGASYLQLKKVKKVEQDTSNPQTPQTSSTQPVATNLGVPTQLDRIEAKIDKLLGVNPKKEEPVVEPDDEPINLDDIPI